MTDLLVCRICLVVNTRMYVISNTPLQEIYEKITDIPLQTDDGKAVMACYICYHRLRKCQGFIQKSVKADKLLRQILGSGLQVSVLSIALIDKSYLSSSLGVSPTQLETYDPESQNEDVLLKNEFEVKIERYVDKEETDEVLELTAHAVSSDSPSYMLVGNVVPEDPEPVDSDDSDDHLPLKPKVESEPKKRPSVQNKVVKPRKTRVRKKKGERKGGRPRGPLADAREVILTKEEQLLQMLERSRSRNFTSSRHKCELCYKGFRDTGTYGKHMLRHDQRLRFECEVCHLRYDSKKNLRSHAAKAHERRYVCNKCEHQSMSAHAARVHDKWHEGHRYECKHCGQTFSKVTTYMSHIRIKHASDFVCGLCGFTFVSEKGIEIHKTRSHKPTEIAMPLTGPHCADCDVTFASEAAHDRHLELSSRHSSGKGPKRLRNDMQVLNTKKRRRELRLAQGDADPRDEEQEPITCEQCGLRLGSLALYAWHFRRAHPGRNRTKYSCLRSAAMCEQCGKICQSRTVLEAHMWVHTGTRRHKCPECDRSYVHKNSLLLHIQTHRPHNVRKTFECPICGKSFTLYSNRRRHMFTHTGFKSYQCESCGKGFTSEASRKSHMEHVHLKKQRPKRIRGPRKKTVLEPEN